ncbi:MAG: exosome complex RNA-binding protein Rrp4 [Candidatus Aenigmarchaeota archaeon]|nr:exosome complex RNA-binding protein Rrp4 [Candidatus Aenigmarchaeota archaeon]
MKKVRKIILPGEIVGNAKDKRSSYGTFVEEGNIVSKFLGILRESGGYLSVIPLSGVYIPRKQDKVIGFITDVERMGWIVDINSPWQAFLSLSEAVDEFIDLKRFDISKFYDVGDIVYAQVSDVKRGDVQLTMRTPMARKLKDGVTIKITPSKVPRLIGKEGSMINIVKEKTGTTIRVGQNGVVWISGEKVEKAIKVIKMIDEKAHIIGLTDEISKLLSD